jgi:hypothetical protein
MMVTLFEGWKLLGMGPSGSDDPAGDDVGEARGKYASSFMFGFRGA